MCLLGPRRTLKGFSVKPGVIAKAPVEKETTYDEGAYYERNADLAVVTFHRKEDGGTTCNLCRQTLSFNCGEIRGEGLYSLPEVMLCVVGEKHALISPQKGPFH